MRSLSLLGLAFLAACNPGGIDGFNVDTGPIDDDTTVDGTEADTEDDTSDIDTEPDTEEGISGNGGDCHLLDPLDLSGWSRTYATNYGGVIGTEVQTAGGLQTAPNGDSGYQINSTITPQDGTPPIQITRYATCQNGAAFWLGDDVQGSASIELIPGFPLPADLHTESYPLSDAQYLPSASAIDSGLYTFTYSRLTKDLNAENGDAGIGAILGLFGGGSAPVPNCKSDPSLAENDATCVDVETTVTAFGQQNVTVGGVTYAAYFFVEDTEEAAVQSGTGQPGGAGDIGALLEALGFGNVFGDLFGLGGGEPSTIRRALWYVEGIGIVKEEAYDLTNGQSANDDNLIVLREMTSLSGL